MRPPFHVKSYVRWCDDRRWAIIAGSFALFLVAGVVSARLELRTSFAELLPSDDPGVKALAETQRRMGDISVLLIGVRSPDRAANLRYAEALTRHLNGRPDVCALAVYHFRDFRELIEKQKWLYLSETELERVRDVLRREILRRKNPLFVDLGAEETVDDLKAHFEKKNVAGDRFDEGYFSRKDSDYIWIAAVPPGGAFVEHAGEALVAVVNGFIADTPPDRAHPEMRVHVGGPVATALQNREAVERDIIWITAICISVVALSIGLYFRRTRVVPVVGIPAALGTLLAFAVAELAFGHLTSSTAFLGSIILGNGINYAIVLAARYEEGRAAGLGLHEALEEAIGGVWKGTLVAALSASASYASLMMTSFRGFSQFGVMGGAGWILCWAATFVLVPALFFVVDRKTQHGQRMAAPIRMAALGRSLERRPGAFLAGSIALTFVALLGARHFLHDPFEYDFRRLNMKMSKTDEAKRFGDDMDALFGRWHTPTVILADRVEDVESLRAAIRQKDAVAPGRDVIGNIVTVFDLLPGTAEVQRRKLALIEQIRLTMEDPAVAALDEEDREALTAYTPPQGLSVIGPADLPALMRRPFTETDGTLGRVLLVYPVEQGVSVWNGRDLLKIASVLQELPLDDGRILSTSGAAVIFGSMIRSVLRDGPVATAASLAAVFLIVVLTIRPWRLAGLALATMAIAVIWMVGIAGWIGVKVTFLNFIALPITFGVGIEYALNVVSRFRERGHIGDTVSSTGGAVALCSWATVVGYASLLAAQNQALRGFGAMSILGEIACLSAAVIALPAFLIVRRRQKATP